MRTTKGAAILATSAAMALVLGACSGGGNGGGGGDDAGGGGGEGAVVEGDGDVIDINSHAREDLEQGGTLRIAIGEGLPSQWNPMHVNGNEGDIDDVRDLMAVRMWDYDAEGVPSPNPNYLEDYEVDDSGDQQVVTLNLNPDAVWNSGESITWEDVAATLTICDGTNDVQCVQTGPYEAIESVEQGENEFQVVITYDGIRPDWQSPLDEVVPASAIADDQMFNERWLEYHEEDWTGPYVIDDINDAQQIITLVPNENWWGDAPLLDEVQFHAMSTESQPNAFQNGELDAFEVGPDPNAYNTASQVADAEIRTAAAPDWRHVTFNSEAGVLQELEVRQAIQKGINREAIAASDLAGLPEELQLQLGNHLYVNGQDGYQDNTGEFAYDPDAASAQLEEAGWEMNEETGIRERDGEPLQVRFMVLTGVPVSENEGQLIQEQLREIGIDVQLQQQDVATWGEALSNGDFQMIAFSWLGTQYPLANIAQIYGNPETNESNYANLNNPELNELIREVDSEADPERRTELANEVDQMIWESGHTLPLYQRPQIYATVSNLANYGAYGFHQMRPENWGYVAE